MIAYKDLFNLSDISVDSFNVETANITTLIATDAIITTQTCGTMYSTTENATTLNATTANLTSAVITNSTISSASVSTLTSTSANITSASIPTLSSTTSNITTLTCTTANITNATATNLSSTNASFYSCAITSVIDATSTTSGALQVAGGMGIAKSIYMGTSGTLTVSNVTDSTSRITGALLVSGGLGVAKTICATDFKIKGDVSYTNSNFLAMLRTSANADYSASGGTLTGTLGTGASISDGYLSCVGSGGFVTYPTLNNITFTQTCAINMIFKPNYSGTPADSNYLIRISGAASAKNTFGMHHRNDGNFRLDIYNSSGVSVFLYGVPWSPVAGTEYEIEVNMDFNIGATRIFINGAQLGTTKTNTATRTATNLDTDFYVGGHISTPSNGSVRNFVIYNTVQHTSNYTPTYGYAYSDLCTLTTPQTISAVKTFTATPVMTAINSGTSGLLTLPAKTGTLACLDDIVAPANMVTTDTAQTISGQKTFSSEAIFSSGIGNGTYNYTLPSKTGTLACLSDITVPANMVTTDTSQTISGQKTFSSQSIFSSGIGNGTYNYTLPAKTGTLACLDDITAPANMVTTDTSQTISGQKTFSAISTFSNTTDSSTSTNGGVIISGGLGIAKQLYVGTNIFSNTIISNTYLVCKGDPGVLLQNSSGNSRWCLVVHGTEGGSDSGSTFYIQSRNDAGDFKQNVVQIDRADGKVTLIGGLQVSGSVTIADQLKQPYSYRWTKLWDSLAEGYDYITLTFSGTDWTCGGEVLNIACWDSAPDGYATRRYAIGGGRKSDDSTYHTVQIYDNIYWSGAGASTHEFTSDSTTSTTWKLKMNFANTGTRTVTQKFDILVQGATLTGVSYGGGSYS